MDVTVELERKKTVKVPYANVTALMGDVDKSLRCFPKLKRLSKVDEGCFLVELNPMGAAGVSHSVAWAARYTVDVGRGAVAWKPVAGKGGNSDIEGDWVFTPRGEQVDLVFRTRGTFKEISVPLALRPFAASFVKMQFTAVVERYLERIAELAQVQH
jgi:hypothetical protein